MKKKTLRHEQKQVLQNVKKEEHREDAKQEDLPLGGHAIALHHKQLSVLNENHLIENHFPVMNSHALLFQEIDHQEIAIHETDHFKNEEKVQLENLASEFRILPGQKEVKLAARENQ